MAETRQISEYPINEKIVRMNAFITMIVILLFVITEVLWFAVAMVIDFFIRAFVHPGYSPIAIMSKALLTIFRLKSYTIDPGAEIFAYKIGFMCCVLMSILHLFSVDKLSILIGCILAIFASLEALVGYSVGCKIYHQLEKFR